MIFVLIWYSLEFHTLFSFLLDALGCDFFTASCRRLAIIYLNRAWLLSSRCNSVQHNCLFLDVFVEGAWHIGTRVIVQIIISHTLILSSSSPLCFRKHDTLRLALNSIDSFESIIDKIMFKGFTTRITTMQYIVVGILLVTISEHIVIRIAR